MTDNDPAATVLPQHLLGAGRIATSAELRHRHLAEVLWYLRANGPTSRADTAAGCHISPSTMTDLVHELMARKLIHELPVVRGGRGRPKQPIAIDGSPWCVVGVQLTPTAVLSAAVTLGGHQVWQQRTKAALDPHDPAAQLGRVLGQHMRALPPEKRLVGVGVALPDAMARAGADQHESAGLSAVGIVARKRLRAALTDAGIPEVTVTVAGETQLEGLHVARSVLGLQPDQTALYVGGGPALAGVVIMDGQIAPGRSGRAGDVAHLVATSVAGAGRCWCGRVGCLDTIASLPAILRRGGLATETTNGSTDDPSGALTWIRAEAAAANPAVLHALDEAGTALNRSLDAACRMLDPAVVIIGGHLGALRGHLPRVDDTMPLAATGESGRVLVEYVGPLEFGPVLGAALAAQDACLTEPLTCTKPFQRSAAIRTHRRGQPHEPRAEISA